MTTRRDFLRTSTTAAVVLAGAPALLLRSRASADIVIRNGNVFDGLGAPSREADVVISAGRVVSIGRRAADQGTVEIDARGLAVAPGFIDTDMTKALPEDARTALLGQIALGHLGEPDDIAAAVAFLAGPGAKYITGETLHVNGGMYMP